MSRFRNHPRPSWLTFAAVYRPGPRIKEVLTSHMKLEHPLLVFVFVERWIAVTSAQLRVLYQVLGSCQGTSSLGTDVGHAQPRIHASSRPTLSPTGGVSYHIQPPTVARHLISIGPVHTFKLCKQTELRHLFLYTQFLNPIIIPRWHGHLPIQR